MTPILLLLLATLTAQAATFVGKVVGVSDGDTITVLAAGNKQFKIRLLAIDTPESGQAYGDKAKQALSKKIFGKVVTFKRDEMDRCKRILGDVYLDTQWINLELVKEGLGGTASIATRARHWSLQRRWCSSRAKVRLFQLEARLPKLIISFPNYS